MVAGVPLSRSHSFKITLSNNRTEKEAVEYVRVHDPRVVVPDLTGRKAIIGLLGIPPRLSRAFDFVRVEEGLVRTDVLPEEALDRSELVEVKATKARLPRLPFGFFFGATANEFELGGLLGDRFRFCFVCLHPETPGHVYVTLPELEGMIRNRRIQYQINLKNEP